MATLTVGDLIKDNLGRKGIVAERSPKPESSWLKVQDDRRMRTARGPWWHVLPLDGGGVVVPESLARRLRRASVDDVAALMDSDDTDKGAAILRFLFANIRARSVRSPRPKRAGRR